MVKPIYYNLACDLIPELRDNLTEDECLYADKLAHTYIEELSVRANIVSSELKRFNYQTLFELGTMSNNPVVKHLLLTGNPIARHLIVAHGYLQNKH